MRIPDGALGKFIAARKNLALAGCKRKGAVCICNTINFSTKFFVINEHCETGNAKLSITLYIFEVCCSSAVTPTKACRACVRIPMYSENLVNTGHRCDSQKYPSSDVSIDRLSI